VQNGIKSGVKRSKDIASLTKEFNRSDISLARNILVVSVSRNLAFCRVDILKIFNTKLGRGERKLLNLEHLISFLITPISTYVLNILAVILCELLERLKTSLK